MRQHWLQARGYRDATTYAATLPGVDGDRIALWGDSFSAAVAIVVAGVDERVAAVVAQVPATGREPAPAGPDGGLYGRIATRVTPRTAAPFHVGISRPTSDARGASCR